MVDLGQASWSLLALACIVAQTGRAVKGELCRGAVRGTDNLYAQNNPQAEKEKSCQAMEESPKITSK